jgi:multicomponent Na+:H+ antiporter subunit C
MTSLAPTGFESVLTPNLTLVLVVVGLVAVGTSLALDRSLVRVLLGMVLIGNGVAVLYLVVSGRAGRAPFVGEDPAAMSDPLPQAMVLTAIVIALATAAFLVTMAYRSFQLNGHDEVQDDVEDARIRALAEADEASDSFEEIRFSDTGADVVSE